MDENVTNNEQIVTSNKQKVMSNDQKVRSNEQKLTSNKQRAKRSASFFQNLIPNKKVFTSTNTRQAKHTHHS